MAQEQQAKLVPYNHFDSVDSLAPGKSRALVFFDQQGKVYASKTIKVLARVNEHNQIVIPKLVFEDGEVLTKTVIGKEAAVLVSLQYGKEGHVHAPRYFWETDPACEDAGWSIENHFICVQVGGEWRLARVHSYSVAKAVVHFLDNEKMELKLSTDDYYETWRMLEEIEVQEVCGYMEFLVEEYSMTITEAKFNEAIAVVDEMFSKPNLEEGRKAAIMLTYPDCNKSSCKTTYIYPEFAPRGVFKAGVDEEFQGEVECYLEELGEQDDPKNPVNLEHAGATFKRLSMDDHMNVYWEVEDPDKPNIWRVMTVIVLPVFKDATGRYVYRVPQQISDDGIWKNYRDFYVGEAWSKSESELNALYPLSFWGKRVEAERKPTNTPAARTKHAAAKPANKSSQKKARK